MKIEYQIEAFILESQRYNSKTHRSRIINPTSKELNMHVIELIFHKVLIINIFVEFANFQNLSDKNSDFVVKRENKKCDFVLPTVYVHYFQLKQFSIALCQQHVVGG